MIALFVPGCGLNMGHAHLALRFCFFFLFFSFPFVSKLSFIIEIYKNIYNSNWF